jgi:hypothetical protein
MENNVRLAHTSSIDEEMAMLIDIMTTACSLEAPVQASCRPLFSRGQFEAPRLTPRVWLSKNRNLKMQQKTSRWFRQGIDFTQQKNIYPHTHTNRHKTKLFKHRHKTNSIQNL